MSKPSVNVGTGAVAILAIVVGLRLWDAPSEYDRELATRPPFDRARETADFEAYRKRMKEYVPTTAPVAKPPVQAAAPGAPPALPAANPPVPPATQPAPVAANGPAATADAAQPSAPAAATSPPPAAAANTSPPPAASAGAPNPPPAAGDGAKVAATPADEVTSVVQSTKTVGAGDGAYTVETVIEHRQPSLRERMERKAFTLRNAAAAND